MNLTQPSLGYQEREVDGFELYQKLQEIDNKAKICFMTAFEI